MGPTAEVGIIFLVVGLILLPIAYFIGVKKRLVLMAGFDPDQVRDKDGLARWVGRGLSIMGALDALTGLAILVLPSMIFLLGAVYMLVTLGGAIVLIAGARKYAR